MSNGTVHIYGCGGAGTNIASTFIECAEGNDSYASLSITAIDTSRSNLRGDLTEDQCFFIPDVDGSGKLRSENHIEIGRAIKPLLVKRPPGAFNIVVFSGSGGSGSVAGPLLIKELIERGETVVGVMVGSSESSVTCTNTLNTFKTLDSISEATNAPVVVVYERNSEDTRRGEVDLRLQRAITALTALAAPSNRELDTRDLSNWVNYSRTSPQPAQVARLNIFTGDDDFSHIGNPLSIASLLGSTETPLPKIVTDYSCTGYRTGADDAIPDIHGIIEVDSLVEVHKQCLLDSARFKELEASRDTTRKGFREAGDSVTDSCLVL